MGLSRRLLRALRHGTVLVDAHNLCFRDPLLADLMRQDPERARHALEHRLRGRKRTVLFYDGGPGGTARTVARAGLHCVYSGTGTGDDAIVAWLRRCRQADPVVVVSDDRQLQERCRGFGALACAAADYLTFSGAAAAPADGSRSEEAVPDPAEVRYWLRAFGAEDEMEPGS